MHTTHTNSSPSLERHITYVPTCVCIFIKSDQNKSLIYVFCNFKFFQKLTKIIQNYQQQKETLVMVLQNEYEEKKQAFLNETLTNN